ncbi:unnamed protein product [Sphagnum tenellum]
MSIEGPHEGPSWGLSSGMSIEGPHEGPSWGLSNGMSIEGPHEAPAGDNDTKAWRLASRHLCTYHHCQHRSVPQTIVQPLHSGTPPQERGYVI